MANVHLTKARAETKRLGQLPPSTPVIEFLKNALAVWRRPARDGGPSDGNLFAKTMLEHQPTTLGEVDRLWQGKRYRAFEHLGWGNTSADGPVALIGEPEAAEPERAIDVEAAEPERAIDVEAVLTLLAQGREQIEAGCECIKQAEALLRGARLH
jgi:hypothetical protein